jgi:monofunctional biosynthetic peptidoglycan transglycosylase
MTAGRPSWLGPLRRLVALSLLCALALQAVFAMRIAVMAALDPWSTTFQRSEAFRLLANGRLTSGAAHWQHRWVGIGAISKQLQRAVIASEDAGFVDHHGVEWDAITNAWDRNQRAAERARKRAEARASGRAQSTAARVVGGSTISQQLAKNLFLSGERTVLRKAQELVLTLMLEACLSKQRILEIYLNHVEWGEGIFGAQAAAQRYLGTDAARLGASAAAGLAVMLPAPKRYERQPASPYLLDRAATIAARMAAVDIP